MDRISVAAWAAGLAALLLVLLMAGEDRSNYGAPIPATFEIVGPAECPAGRISTSDSTWITRSIPQAWADETPVSGVVYVLAEGEIIFEAEGGSIRQKAQMYQPVCQLSQ